MALVLKLLRGQRHLCAYERTIQPLSNVKCDGWPSAGCNTLRAANFIRIHYQNGHQSMHNSIQIIYTLVLCPVCYPHTSEYFPLSLSHSFSLFSLNPMNSTGDWCQLCWQDCFVFSQFELIIVCIDTQSVLFTIRRPNTRADTVASQTKSSSIRLRANSSVDTSIKLGPSSNSNSNLLLSWAKQKVAATNPMWMMTVPATMIHPGTLYCCFDRAHATIFIPSRLHF